MKDVEWSFPVGLDVKSSSHPHVKTISRTRRSGLDKQYQIYGAGRGGVDCWGTGAWVKLVLSKLKLDPRPATRWHGTDSAISVDQRVASRVLCRNNYRPVTLLLSMLSSLSQQLPRKKGDHDASHPNIGATALTTNSIGCRGFLPGDSAGFTVRRSPQIPKVNTIY